jgi:protein-tyrosine sulfotransferase
VGTGSEQAGCGSRPIFILSAARSGSTLLRLLLDAHPEIAAPPELNLCNVFESIRFSATSVAAGTDGGAADQDLACELSQYVADRIIGSYPRKGRKQRWCDKSLASIEKPEIIASVFPDAEFICLYRECADTVASLKEACEWGFAGYGVEPYARMYAHNMAMALCTYWADRVSAEREFEDEHRCHRVRYEDLVAHPEETLALLFEFLEVARVELEICAPGVLERARSPIPGDPKARYTQAIHSDSVGRGWQVPAEMLDAALIQRINRLADELGYQPLLSDLASIKGLSSGGDEPAEQGSALEELTELLVGRVAERLSSGAHQQLDHPIDSRVRLVLADGTEPWVVDFGQGRVERGEADGAGWTVLSDAETLLEIVHGQCNPAVALRCSRLRLASTDASSPEAFLRHLDALVAVLSDRVAH